MRKQLQSVIDTVKELVGDQYLYFDTPVQIKITPHTLPFNIWGACVAPDEKLYVMDAEQQWYKVEDSQMDCLIANSLYQRVKTLQLHFKTVNV